MHFEYGDTQNIKDVANEIISQSNEYNIQINNLFKKLNGISTETKEWIGTKADKYNQLVALDKKQYTDFYETLKSFAKELENIANSIEICTKMTQEEQRYNGL